MCQPPVRGARRTVEPFQVAGVTNQTNRKAALLTHTPGSLPGRREKHGLGCGEKETLSTAGVDQKSQ